MHGCRAGQSRQSLAGRNSESIADRLDFCKTEEHVLTNAGTKALNRDAGQPDCSDNGNALGNYLPDGYEPMSAVPSCARNTLIVKVLAVGCRLFVGGINDKGSA